MPDIEASRRRVRWKRKACGCGLSGRFPRDPIYFPQVSNRLHES